MRSADPTHIHHEFEPFEKKISLERVSGAVDRNLLLGIIALQMDFISRDALISAMNAWVLNKGTVLSQILQDQGALNASRRGLLDALVEEHIRVHEGDPQKSLAALSSIGTARQELARISDPDVQASIPLVSAARRDEYDDRYRTVATSSLGESSSTGARFRVLRPHARGGLGQVSVALDQELDRPVALKEMQDGYADDLHDRARFVQEAEITGKLEHPGIIPVYGLGHDASGRPFYAMRFIAGDSLGEAIATFHTDPELKRDIVARNSRLRELLRRFTDVCNAVAYAHSRGVLHRDLKPGNIMLGPYGETLVVDWGLAKAAGMEQSAEPGAALKSGFDPARTEAPIRLSDQSGSRADTVAGAPIGTPAFASPEQITGAIDRLGPGTDIYGLGATLYALLTGRAPVDSGDLVEIIRRLQKGEIPHPRSVNPAVPKPLEAICRKAMALQPEDRYASVRALAADVTRWLDDAPVSAFREPFSARLGRWIRRHPRLVSATVAAVLVGQVAIGLAYSLESVINSLRVVRVKDQISATLDRFEGSEKQFDFVAVKIAELARLAPEELAQQQRWLGEHLVEAAGKMIRQERPLSPADVDKIRGVIARVKDYAPDSISDLEAALRDRLGRLDPVFTLAGPFDGLAGVFEPESVRIEGQGLVAGGNGPARGDRVIPSKVLCNGDVEIEGTFTLTPGLAAGTRFGLALNASADRGYFFTLSRACAALPGPARSTPAGEAPPERLTMTIERNKVVLRQTEVEIRGSKVTVFAQKKGDKLSFTTGRTELGFDDIFPLSAAAAGVFGVVLSDGVRLDGLEARKQQLPSSPSRLERGDAFYSQGEFDKALEEFGRVESTTDQADLKSEALYKKALCLVERQREAEAKPIFEGLAAGKGPWQSRAACQVWKLLLKTASPSVDDIQQADQMFATLNATVDYAQLALVLSEEERDQILAYYRQVGYYPRINWSPLRVQNLKRALKIEELIKSDRHTQQRTLWRLADAYRLDGREPDAVETIQKLLSLDDLLLDDRIGMSRDYASMMISGGTPGKALDEINKQLARLATHQKGAEPAMLLIRSRLHAALKDWDMAEKDVTRFIETARKESISYSDFAEACLFRGFLLERGGHKDEAAKAWRAGLRTNWPKSLPFFAPSNRLLDGKALRDSSRALLHFTMLASLVGELGLEETDTIVSESMGYGDFKLGSLIKFFDLAKENSVLEPHHIRAIVLGQYNTPLGHEFARRAAYLEISLKEEFNRPLLLAVESEIRLSAIPEGAEPELARLIDEGLAEINQAHQESRFDDSQLMKMFRAWMGGTGIFGWSGLERSMNNMPELRGKIAYVYGRRFLVLKQPEFARRLFQLSTRDLPVSSQLHKLAQVQLDKLGAK